MSGLPGQTFSEQENELDKLYAGCCDHDQLYKLSALDDLAARCAAMAKEVWEAKGMPYIINKEIAGAFAGKLWGGVLKGFGKGFGDVDYGTPDHVMLDSLQSNVYHFGAAKNFQQLKALSLALVGPDGKLRNYNQYKQAAFEINDKHVNQWLKTEYNTSIASAQMASKWVSFEANKGTMAILEFDAVMDGRTSDICKSLNGVRKAVDDPFWDTWYPPNHFNERGTVRQRSGKYQTPDSKIEYPEIPAMFKTNLAKNGLVFPEGHAYWKDLPNEVLNEADKLIPDAE